MRENFSDSDRIPPRFIGKRGRGPGMARKIKQTMKHTLAQMYLDWVNNFLTVGKFADHYGLTRDEALSVIERGRLEHEATVEK